MRLLPIAATTNLNILPLAAPHLLAAVPLVCPTLVLLLPLVLLLIPAMVLFIPTLLSPTTAAAATSSKVALAAGIPISRPLPAAARAVVLLLLAGVVWPFPATVSSSSSILPEALLPLAIAVPAWTVVFARPAVSAITHPLLLLLLERRAQPPGVIMVGCIVIRIQVLQGHAALGERLLLLLPPVTAAERMDVWFTPGGVTAL